MRDRPKGGMKKQPSKKDAHLDAKQDAKMLKQKVKKSCLK